MYVGYIHFSVFNKNFPRMVCRIPLENEILKPDIFSVENISRFFSRESRKPPCTKFRDLLSYKMILRLDL